MLHVKEFALMLTKINRNVESRIQSMRINNNLESETRLKQLFSVHNFVNLITEVADKSYSSFRLNLHKIYSRYKLLLNCKGKQGFWSLFTLQVFVSNNRRRILKNLEAGTFQEICNIPPEIFRKVMDSVMKRMRLCRS